jgi:hypothetical protein
MGGGHVKACAVSGGVNTLERTNPKGGSAVRAPSPAFGRERVRWLLNPLQTGLFGADVKRGMASREVSGNRRGETFEGKNPKSVTGAKQTRGGWEGTRRQEAEKACRCRPGGIGPPPTWNPSLPGTL